jgi:ribosomal protein S18 acetylase RimI-like enzyme
MNESTTSSLTRAIEDNRFQAFSTFGRVPGGSLLATEKIIRVIPPIQLPLPLCAWVFNAKFSQNNSIEEVSEVIDYFEQRDIPFLWETGPSTEPLQLGRILEAKGMGFVFNLAGMALDLEELKNQEVPSGLEACIVDKREDLLAWAHAFREGFELAAWSESGIIELIGDAWEQSQGKWCLCVGTINETPVASSSMYVDQGVAGIYFVGTTPMARRRGIGTWMTWRILQEARALGIRVSILHAAPKAVNLYRGLGFKEYSKLGIYELGMTGKISLSA